MGTRINLFCHRGLYGCTDVNRIFLRMPYAKGKNLKELPPENSYDSIKAALELGFNVELDVCMTKDNVLIVTHTNRLMAHVENVGRTDYVSMKSFREIKRLRTGLGGKKAPFLSYEDFIKLFQEYPMTCANVEIKGTIEQENALPPQTKPSIVEQLVKYTPSDVRDRIIWSSFSTEMITELKKINPQARVAQLFCALKAEETVIFKGRTDRYLQFTRKNLERIYETVPLDAAHVEISTLTDNDALLFCRDNHIHIRTWALWERNPESNTDAFRQIQKIKLLRDKYPEMQFDIITDYAKSVERILRRLQLNMS